MYNNSIDRIDNQIKELENLKNNYQNIQKQQPINIYNTTNSPVINFEAVMIDENTKPNEVIVQHRTAFICLKNRLLSIKEINGDIKEYEIVIPKTPEQIENEKLKEKIKELEKQLKEKKK